jgi:hypothetical protein
MLIIIPCNQLHVVGTPKRNILLLSNEMVVNLVERVNDSFV